MRGGRGWLLSCIMMIGDCLFVADATCSSSRSSSHETAVALPVLHCVASDDVIALYISQGSDHTIYNNPILSCFRYLLPSPNMPLPSFLTNIADKAQSAIKDSPLSQFTGGTATTDSGTSQKNLTFGQIQHQLRQFQQTYS